MNQVNISSSSDPYFSPPLETPTIPLEAKVDLEASTPPIQKVYEPQVRKTENKAKIKVILFVRPLTLESPYTSRNIPETFPMTCVCFLWFIYAAAWPQTPPELGVTCFGSQATGPSVDPRPSTERSPPTYTMDPPSWGVSYVI
mgnify:CR=1 FL=1